MVIYVVKSGDTLWDLSSDCGVSMDKIVEANRLEYPEDLVVGQTIIIPINSYTVKEGEGLAEIAKKLGITYRELVSYNNLDFRVPIYEGQILQIPYFEKRELYTNAYIDLFADPASEQDAIEFAPLLTYLAPFSYMVEPDGTLIPPALGNLPQIARDNNAALMLVITNVTENGFDEELGMLIVTNEDVQDRILDQAIQIAKEKGYQDVHFDLEFLPVDTREDYNRFLKKAKQRLSKNNLLLSTALAPKTRRDQKGQWYEAHDYRAHGQIADFVILMTYEWGYTFGLPMPVSPMGPVKQVVEYALREMPASKIFLGQNLYGYDWRAPYEIDREAATPISPNRAIRLAWEKKQSISYDEKAEAPYFKYIDDDGREHTVWFEDARSIAAKFDLIRRYNLRGISYWRLGYDFPQNWYMLDNQFDIKKFK